MKLTTIGIITITSLVLSSCYYNNFRELNPEVAIGVSNCDTIAAISYSAQIVPILNANCTGGCHNGTGSGHLITSHGNASADALSGQLYNSVAWNGSASNMPQGASAKIADCDIAKIRLWAAQGALNN